MHAKAGIVLEIQPDGLLVISRTRKPNTLQWHISAMEELAFHTINTFYSDKRLFSAMTQFKFAN